MINFKVTYTDGKTKVIQADTFGQQGLMIIFFIRGNEADDVVHAINGELVAEVVKLSEEVQ